MAANLIVGDCVEQMALMAEASVDAIVCDPPYGLEFMGKQWDRLIDKRPRKPKPRELGGGSAPHIQSRVSYEGGSAAQGWHYRWAVQALRVLKPGGHLVAFGGTRTYHRMVCAVEDAGFEIRDTLMWLYAQGFPKSHNLHGEWSGWGTALKPAVEPVVLARKPLQGTVAANVSRFGVGALNIDGCRIASDTMPKPTTAPGWDSINAANARQSYRPDGYEQGDPSYVPSPSGRWPANLLLDDEAATMLDQQTGNRPGSHTQQRLSGNGDSSMFGVGGGPHVPFAPFDDSGGASRFFYCAKASSRERNQGLDGEWSLLRETDGEPVRRAGAMVGNAADKPNRTAGDGVTPVRPVNARNAHPTVKPIALMRWLCRLVTPPGGLILDPFAGSGSTLIAAHLEGFRSIGIELDPDYARIAEARLAWWQAQPQQTSL